MSLLQRALYRAPAMAYTVSSYGPDFRPKKFAALESWVCMIKVIDVPGIGFECSLELPLPQRPHSKPALRRQGAAFRLCKAQHEECLTGKTRGASQQKYFIA